MRLKGFTLVELLVVITIVSVLAAILLPTLQKARQAANKVSCMNNLSQINFAIGMYEESNSNYLPCPAGSYIDPDTGGYACWIHLIAPYLELPSKATTHYSIAGGLRAPVLCPSAKSYNHPRIGYSKKAVNITYGWSWIFCHDPGSTQPTVWEEKRTKPNNSKSKENLIMMADGHSTMISAKIDPERTEYGVFLRHMGGANYLFLDGSVKYSNVFHLLTHTEYPWR